MEVIQFIDHLKDIAWACDEHTYSTYRLLCTHLVLTEMRGDQVRYNPTKIARVGRNQQIIEATETVICCDVLVSGRFYSSHSGLRCKYIIHVCTLQWRHNERDGVSNHMRLDCLLNRLFRRRSKKTSMFRVTRLCGGNSPVTGDYPSQSTGEFPLQRVRNEENVSIR